MRAHIEPLGQIGNEERYPFCGSERLLLLFPKGATLPPPGRSVAHVKTRWIQ
jgi:hypothetical protein